MVREQGKLTCRDCASYSWNRKLHMLVWPSVEQADAARWQVDVVSALPYRSCQLGHFDFACSILITFPSEPPPLKHFLVVPLSLCCCFFSHPVLLLLAFVAWVVRETQNAKVEKQTECQMLLFAGVLIVRKCTPVWVKIQNPVKLCDADKSMEHAQLFRWTRSTRTPASAWDSLPSEGREGICNSQRRYQADRGERDKW